MLVNALAVKSARELTLVHHDHASGLTRYCDRLAQEFPRRAATGAALHLRILPEMIGHHHGPAPDPCWFSECERWCTANVVCALWVHTYRYVYIYVYITFVNNHLSLHSAPPSSLLWKMPPAPPRWSMLRPLQSLCHAESSGALFYFQLQSYLKLHNYIS